MNRRLISLLAILWGAMGYIHAQNPISPMGVYIADPTARVWSDNKLYIYGSLDETTKRYCSRIYHTLSTDNL